MFPKLSKFWQNWNCKNIAEQMLAEVDDGSELLQCITTGDEMWVYGYAIKNQLNYPNGNLLTTQEKKPIKFILITILFYTFNHLRRAIQN